MLNYCMLVGRVGQNPEIRVSQSGKKVCRLSLATNSFYNGKPVTEWHTIVLFDGMAENIEKFVRKGSVVGVLGSIQYSKYKDKNGVEKTATSILCKQLHFIDLRGGEQQATQTVNSDGTQTFGSEVNHDAPDEIPF